ncbi:glucans biosynthesis glucosyltransferase MdoH [Pedosphaera parvula]|uniref:Glucans biosynthesis glucosyltransferase H n=1 Tax=Pedosphaera parvula (strain Ellin514) TaxID=320771 RepID=B9XK82_PEDPL|nr:glucans biosynthesis glucosyltransferase MdoH [Pedosphaera parvula]EEF59720.1 glycosyl transferase family 2 [Pedosphaera parvula Ellin514]
MSTVVQEPATLQSAKHAPSPKLVRMRPARRGLRVFLFYSSAVLMTGVVSLLFADLLWRTGWTTSKTILLGLFILLFFFAAIGCVHAVVGFMLRRVEDNHRITRLNDYSGQSIDGTSTAIIFPIYNEEVLRVYEGLRTTYESLEKTGELGKFDFFILSDSRSPDKWVEEERRWFDVIKELGALGRIYYRRRVSNEGKKSGNVRDFLNTWGRRYRYFIVCDADSVMRGQTIVDLVKMMEVNQGVGLIQTVPALVNAESLFGRIQQFANRFYAPIFITGLNYWSQGFGNYWGHNAIIRTEPFMQYCDLPQLPGHRPFGGHILSHDFVEAALLLKEKWQVWLAYDLEGSYEEAPQGLIENAQRDRRWCQGNLQHGMLLFARGLHDTSRLHLIQGIFGYLSGPLWFLFLVIFNWIWAFQKFSGLSSITVHSWTSYLNLSGSSHAFLVFMICMGVIFLPKVLALLDIILDPQRQEAYGGVPRVAASIVVETIFSALHAPLQMLWHTRFVITILMGMGVNWGEQNRNADGTAWMFAIQRHWGHTLTGLIWGGLIWWLAPSMFGWFVPVFAGMVLSIPLSVLTSRSKWGVRARNLGLFLTPEETHPPVELDTLRVRMATMSALSDHSIQTSDNGLTEAVLDPYVNAIHVSLLREKKLNPEYAEALAKLGTGSPEVRVLAEKLLAEGPEALKRDEKVLVMSDADMMSWLHRQVWLRSSEMLAPWWRTAIRQQAR